MGMGQNKKEISNYKKILGIFCTCTILNQNFTNSSEIVQNNKEMSKYLENFAPVKVKSKIFHMEWCELKSK